MTRSEEYGGQRWGIAPPLNETAPEGWEPRIVKMTRLERTEKLIAHHRPNWGAIPLDYCDYAYVIDCYKARVAVLEEALDKIAHYVWKYAQEEGEFSPWRCVDLAIIASKITPEECLARQKGVPVVAIPKNAPKPWSQCPEDGSECTHPSHESEEKGVG